MTTDTERAEFEAWAKKKSYNLSKMDDGEYAAFSAASMWSAWQAARASKAGEATADEQERLRDVDASIWDDIDRSLADALNHHFNPELDELDCTLLQDLVRFYRRRAAHPTTGDKNG